MDYDEVNFIPDYEEDIPTPRPHLSTSKHGRYCPVCKGKFTHVRRHVLREHIPWYIYASTACWACQINLGQKKLLELHIHQEHCSNCKECVYDKDIHEKLWVNKLLSFLQKFNSLDLFHKINNDSVFSSCSTAIFQQEDLEQLHAFVKAAEIHENVPEKPLPVKNILSLFHWRVLALLISNGMYDINSNCLPLQPPRNKSILIVGSSIVYWAHERAKVTGSTSLGLSNVNIEWVGCRGLKWRSLLPTLDNASNKCPNFLVIHLGSNDISDTTAASLCHSMKFGISACKKRFDHCEIVFSHLLCRMFWRGLPYQEGEYRRREVNQEISRFVVSEMNGSIVPHDDITVRDNRLFRSDGVHLTNRGNDIFISDLGRSLLYLED